MAVSDDAGLDDLLWVLDRLRQLLSQTIESAGAYLPAELIDDYLAAWKEVDERYDGILDQVRMADSRRLAEHGLVGPNMQLKRRGFAGAVRDFFAAPSRWTLRHALEWADVALDSLAAVVPPAGLIKEFKQAVEKGLSKPDADAS